MDSSIVFVCACVVGVLLGWHLGGRLKEFVLSDIERERIQREAVDEYIEYARNTLKQEHVTAALHRAAKDLRNAKGRND